MKGIICDNSKFDEHQFLQSKVKKISKSSTSSGENKTEMSLKKEHYGGNFKPMPKQWWNNFEKVVTSLSPLI